MHTLKEYISEEDINKRVIELGKAISEDYAGKQILTISVLKGSAIFTADIVRNLTIPVEMGFIVASSYGSSDTSSGNVKLIYDVDLPVKDKHILIIEDIIDTGNTLLFLKKLFLGRGVASVKICTFLDKPDRRKVDIDIEYVGFQVPDKFIVGYGLDLDNKYRNLKNICTIEN